MKKTIFSMALIIIVGLFSQNSFGQEQEEIDQQALEKERVEIAEIVNNREDMIFDPFNLQKVCQSLIEMAQQNQNEEHIMSASSEEVYSNNTNDFNMFKGTIWSFSFNIGTTTFEDTIIFNDDVFVDDGEMSLPFMIEYDGYEAIGDMAYILSGGEEYTLKGVSQPLYFAYSQGKNLEQCYIFNRVNDNSVKGYYLFRHPFTSEFIDPISFKGVKQPSKPNGVDNDGDGYSENQGDCNDNDNTTYPGAIEICGDGIDQDCNGSDLSCLNEEPPSAPKGVTASDGTLSGMVQVSWNPSAGATSYDVYRADIPAWAGGVPKRIATSVVGTSYDDASAASGKQYYYWVKSKNAGGGSGYSMFDPGYWGARGYVPSVPNNAAASDGTVSDMVTVTWAPVPNSVVYEIYRADYPAYLGGNIRNIGTSTTTSYNDTTVVNAINIITG